MKPIGVYIHIPFCVRKCNYCDFVSYPVVEGHVRAYSEALVGVELGDACGWLKASGRVVDTIYIGGGTPTAVPSRHLLELLRVCKNDLPLEDGAEVTVEMNPGTAGPGYVAELLGAGVNRISIGVQSFCDTTLTYLGRIHTADEARGCIKAVREMGCRNVNLDLIYGTPGESLDELLHSVAAAISLGPEHISVYGLSIPDGTRLHADLLAGRLTPVAAELQREMYEAVREALAGAGYVQYEISSWARPTFECRHNLNYWRLGEYLGLGCAASSHIDGVRRTNIADHLEYARRLSGNKMAVAEQETLTRKQRIDEAIMLGLRMREGIDLEWLLQREGYDLASERSEQIKRLLKSGLIEIEDGWLRLTDDGVLVADEVIVWLV
ncbi:radical SAM family heme chaperone HemW [bacterium]|nr:radical SAM family heme chaperone HemW [bacterium]